MVVEGGGYGCGYFRLLTSLFQHEARVPSNEDAYHTSMLNLVHCADIILRQLSIINCTSQRANSALSGLSTI